MRKFKITVNGVSYNVEVEEAGESAVVPVVLKEAEKTVKKTTEMKTANIAEGDVTVNAPMPGKIAKVIAKAGKMVNKGDVLLLLEAMKMQNGIVAPSAGTVKSINVTRGQSVKPEEMLVVITKK